jgi:acetyl-CoA carboxylase biotin carboxyl carrier protein
MANINLKELKELIDLISEKGFAEFEVERQGFRLRIVRFKEPATEGLSPATTPPPSPPSVGKTSPEPSQIRQTPSSAASPPVAPEGPVEPEPVLRVIKSPIVGTFYRAPSPNSEPFVVVGDRVEPDTVVCIIEAMKLMNEIQAEISGVIAEVYPENAQAVEYGEPLFGIKS